MKNKSFKTKKAKKKVSIEQNWSVLHPNAAGIDLGSRQHWVAIPPGGAERSVRCFGTTTPQLEAMAQWLHEQGVTHVAMEATGVYWIAVFQYLERQGFEVLLVNARQIKNVTGRKSDVLDCQWIQRLHTYGLLGGSFRPADPYCVVRSYLRYREELVAARSVQIQPMQKALLQMNVQLSVVLSDLSGQSGLAIIGAILEGERDPVKLAALAHVRVKSSREQIARAEQSLPCPHLGEGAGARRTLASPRRPLPEVPAAHDRLDLRRRATHRADHSTGSGVGRGPRGPSGPPRDPARGPGGLLAAVRPGAHQA